MKRWFGPLAGCLMLGCLFWAFAPGLATSPGPTAFSQNPSSNSEAVLQVRSVLLPTGIEQVTVVDPRAKSMAIYHVDPANAQIQLKSVRSLVWDLQMEHFNGQAPLPSELRQVQP